MNAYTQYLKNNEMESGVLNLPFVPAEKDTGWRDHFFKALQFKDKLTNDDISLIKSFRYDRTIETILEFVNIGRINGCKFSLDSFINALKIYDLSGYYLSNTDFIIEV